MKYLLFLFMSLPCLADTPRQIAREVEDQIRMDMSESQTGFYQRLPSPRLQVLIDQAMNNALQVAQGELINKGYPEYAEAVGHTWRGVYGASMFNNSGIGAHAPVWAWLAKEYDSVEQLLGREFCISTHIADIKTINYTLPVVFRPCTFPMDGIQGLRIDEYRDHACGKSIQTDEVYNGLIPTVVYWSVYGGCSAATSGIGFMFVCGTVSGIGEQIMANEIAPGLSDDIFHHFCSE